MYDVIVVGGSIAGLLCAREIAKNHSVLVVEEDHEIGTPEHCGGLVSRKGLDSIDVPIQRSASRVNKARLYAPSGKNLEINSMAQNILQIDRRELDKQVAIQAQENGAEIMVGNKFLKFSNNIVHTSQEDFECKCMVDARGIQALANNDREGFLSSAQYQVYADWIDGETVEIYLDQKLYPGFFAWVIPIGKHVGKVGIAGKKINAEKTVEKFMESRGKYSIMRKIFAPIWIKGPIKQFVTNNVITIGDAAGQTKPTTAGGIYSAGMGGILAGNAIDKFLKSQNSEELNQYKIQWHKMFGAEFEKQFLGRKILEKLDNSTIDSLFSAISPEMIQDMAKSEDFDFHSGMLIKMLGVKGTFKIAQMLLGSEFKKLLK